MPAPAATVVAPAVRPLTTSRASIHPTVVGGAAGAVTVFTSPQGVRYHVEITGLRPGTTHAVHDHLGGCAGADRSEHLAVLGIATANNAGVIVLDIAVARALAGPGRIVIVYSSPQPKVITGCADL